MTPRTESLVNATALIARASRAEGSNLRRLIDEVVASDAERETIETLARLVAALVSDDGLDELAGIVAATVVMSEDVA